jgi:phage-related protein
MAGKSAVISVIVTGEATSATKAFADGEKAAKGFGDEVKKVDKGFDSVRDSADNSERRITGFRDSLTGTGDVMKGLKDGDMVLLTTGFADLASSVANLGADLLEWGKKAWTAARQAVAAHGASALATAKDTAAMVAHKVASLASQAATKTAAAAQWLLNAALTANPIGLVIVALAALTAAVVLAWQHSETFRAVVTGAFEAVRGAAEAAFDWIKTNWPLLLAIITGPIGLAVLAITRHWDEIKNGFTGVKDWISDKIDDITGFFTELPDKLKGAGEGMFDWIKGAFITAWDALRSVVNAIKLPSMTIGGWSTPFGTTPSWTSPEIDPIPHLGPLKLARGGITTGPTLAIVGDNPGGREAIIPLPRSGGMGLGATYIVTVAASPGTDRVALGREIKAALMEFERAGGSR